MPFRRLRDLLPGGGARGLISYSLGSRAGLDLGDPEEAGSESIEAWNGSPEGWHNFDSGYTTWLVVCLFTGFFNKATVYTP